MNLHRLKAPGHTARPDGGSLKKRGVFGLGLTVPNLSTWLSSFTPPAMRGRVMGGLTAAVFIGQFVSPLVAQPFVNAYGTAGPFLAASVLLAVLGGVAWGVRNKA